MTFLNSILKQAKKHEVPFDHWEYKDALSEEAIEEIIKADIPDVSKHNLKYDGTRAIDDGAAEFREGIASGGKAIKFRCFITKENASQFPNLVKFINELQSKETYETISKMINKDLSNSYVRVEVICDREGFWLKPHCDIKEKLMSGLIFLILGVSMMSVFFMYGVLRSKKYAMRKIEKEKRKKILFRIWNLET